MTWKGRDWDKGVVSLMVRVAEAMDAGERPSAVLTGLLPASEVRMLDRLSRALSADVVALLARWRRMNDEEREVYMWRVLSNWKRAKGYGE